MKINIARPFQIFQWSSYVVGAIVTHFIIVFPLACMLFNDFYNRLIPSDSSQLVPLSAFELVETSTAHLKYSQQLYKVNAPQELPPLLSNGLNQRIPLREQVDYKVDASFNFYCLIDDNVENPVHNLQRVTVSVYGVSANERHNLLYATSIPIICMKASDSISLPENKQLKNSRMASYRTEWLNKIKIDDVSDFSTDYSINGLSVMFNFPSPKVYNKNGKSYNHGIKEMDAYSLLMEPESNLNFRVNFNQGIRNLMLRYRTITYTIGITVFHITMTILFVLTVGMGFYLTYQKLNETSRPKRA